MRNMQRVARVVLGLAIVGAGALPPAIDVPEVAAASAPDCPASWRAVRLNCRGDAEGLVTGEYGGTSFFLTCDGETSTQICTEGESWRYIMEGNTPDGPAVRCAPVLLAAWLVPGCIYSDLDLVGKRCDAATDCPGDLICVEVPESASSRVGTCHRPEDAPVCSPGELRCEAAGAWIEECMQDGHSWRISQQCQAATTCNPDILACSRSCTSDADCAAEQTCGLGTDLCRPLPACEPAACDGLCIADVCVPRAPGDATTSAGSPELDCFLQPPTQPPADPVTCALTGRVNLFPSKENSDKALGLQVRLLEAAPPYAEIDQVVVTQGADEFGYYTFADVATNQAYLIEVQAGTSDTGVAVVTTLNAPVDLRADACLGGIATAGVSAMPAETFQTYTSGTIEDLDPVRGLVIGRVLDCRDDARRPMGNVTVGLGLPPVAPGRVFYFPDEPYLIPDLGLSATTVKGYYAAAGAPATRNRIAFAALQGQSELALGSVEAFVRPGTALIVDLPLPEQRLPE